MGDLPVVRVGDSSPWDRVQTVRELVPGVYQVSTAGHGGIMVRDDIALAQLSDRALALNRYGGEHRARGVWWICFEEDCEVALPLFEHPEWEACTWEWRYPGATPAEARAFTLRDAEQTLRQWLPQYFDAAAVPHA